MTWIARQPTKLTVVYASGRKEEKEFSSYTAALKASEQFKRLDTVQSVDLAPIRKGR